MPFNQKYYKDLIEINKLLDENKIIGKDEALDKFSKHIKEVKELGRFSIKNWQFHWRKVVYEFGTKFKIENPIEFLTSIKLEKKISTKDESEVLDFYNSEIEIGSLPPETCLPRIKELIGEYPYNPEFRHNFGHYLTNDKKFFEAIEQYHYAYGKDKSNTQFLHSLYQAYLKYLNELYAKAKYDKGISVLENLLKEGIFRGEPHFHNYLISTEARFRDQLLFEEKFKEKENSLNEIIKNETLKGQNKIIEILGFFTAIIAFIFSTISIGKNFKFEEAIIFNISLGLTLLIFVLVINIMFSIKKIEQLYTKILLLIIMVLSLLLIVARFGVPIWL